MNTDLGPVDGRDFEPVTETARQQASEVRQVVLERVHHEFRTPLATLLGHVEMLQDSDATLPYRVEMALAAISRSGDRLTELLARLDELVGESAS